MSVIAPLMLFEMVLDDNRIYGFAFIMLAKHLKAKATESEGATSVRHTGRKGMKQGFN